MKISKICQITLSADVFTTQQNLRKHSTVDSNEVKNSGYLDGIAFRIHGFVPDEKIEVFDAPSQSSGRVIADFGSFFHSYRTRNDELGLFVTRIPQF